jgi:uncharacterized protein with von Willebrand factor type A (vWA) domain
LPNWIPVRIWIDDPTFAHRARDLLHRPRLDATLTECGQVLVEIVHQQRHDCAAGLLGV